MVRCLLDLREELNTGRWDWTHGEKVSNLCGFRFADVPVTRVRALSEAIVGDFQFLLEGDGEGLSKSERIDWARQAMADLIDEELDAVLAHRETLDVAIDRDRASAAARAGHRAVEGGDPGPSVRGGGGAGGLQGAGRVPSGRGGGGGGAAGRLDRGSGG